jgi:glycosyltransferase involved in cell wall biosynthesis
MEYNKVSIIIPIYNEEKTLLEILKRVENVELGLEKEIILVDDASTDNTRQILNQLRGTGRYKIFFHEKNLGKGAALRTGFGNAAGDIIIIQDADLEYDPNEYLKVLEPILKGEADVVYGNRMHQGNPIGYWYYYLGNYIISLVAGILYGGRISDIETCYKFFRREVLDKIKIKAKGFDFEAEFTAKVLKNKFRVIEVPISYQPRSFAEGKKISSKDGVLAIWILVKYRFVDDK